jgi:hypothetical protein
LLTGTEAFRKLRKVAYTNANVVGLTFSCLSRESLINLREWAAEVDHALAGSRGGFDGFVLVGTHGSAAELAAAKAKQQSEVVSPREVFEVRLPRRATRSAHVRACMAAGSRVGSEDSFNYICGDWAWNSGNFPMLNSIMHSNALAGAITLLGIGVRVVWDRLIEVVVALR